MWTQTKQHFEFNEFMVMAVDVYKVTIIDFTGKKHARKKGL